MKISKITPHLWFDKEAKEATEFYTSVFPNSKVTAIKTLHDTPSGDCDVVSFELWGHQFIAISAGPLFRFNPSVSFMVNFDPSQVTKAKERLDHVWEKLSDGGTILMELDNYPFSERYGWVQDKYGLSWQLILTDPKGERRPPVIPSLLFVTDTGDKAEAATEFYLSVFRNSKRGTMARYPAGMEPNIEGAVMFTDFMLEGQWFAAMDGKSDMHKFSFNEAVSFVVNCDTQEEIDYYWEKLSAVPEAEQCGWIKDKYGLSWQVVPAKLGEIMKSGNQDQVDRVTRVSLKMKKFDVEKLEHAYKAEE
jgi:predicted 3-demethylubiquinone-9 3-methyltransferase (glyoxalase superfamily)